MPRDERYGVNAAAPLPRLLIAAALLLAAVHMALGRAHAHPLGNDDDRLMLYFTGAAVGRWAAADAMQRRVADSLREAGAPEDRSIRMDMIADRILGYAGASAMYRLSCCRAPSNQATRSLPASGRPSEPPGDEQRGPHGAGIGYGDETH